VVTDICRVVFVEECVTHCSALQHTATRCNALEYAVAHCSTLQHTAAHCSTRQRTAAHGSALQHTAAHCSTLQHTATHCSTLQHTAAHYSTLQHTAEHCSTLHYNATHYNTLQHTAARCSIQQHSATHCHTLQRTTAHCKSLQLTLTPCLVEYACCGILWGKTTSHTLQTTANTATHCKILCGASERVTQSFKIKKLNSDSQIRKKKGTNRGKTHPQVNERKSVYTKFIVTGLVALRVCVWIGFLRRCCACAHARDFFGFPEATSVMSSTHPTAG